MVKHLSFVLVTAFVTSTVQNGLSQSPGSTESNVTLCRPVAQSCELLQKGTLLSEGGYVSLRVEGVAEEIYSPELGKEDIVGYAASTPQELVKLAKKSGFRMKPVSSTEESGLPKVAGPTCPGLEPALQAAEQDRIDRRHEVQSRRFKAGVDGVSPPEAIDTPPAKAVPQEASSASQSSQPTDGAQSKPQQAEVLLSAVVTSNGDVDQIKVLRSTSPEIDQKAVQTARSWKFKPGRKNGLPVPVVINVEISVHLY